MRRPRLARWSVGVAALAAALAATLAATLGAVPASAITHGDLDGDAHPYVGFMIAKDADGAPLWVCSGTLLSPTVYLTAGHCTQEPAVTADIWFEADLTDVEANNLPYSGDARGTTHPHPDYDAANFPRRDVGVVLLDDPVSMPQYGALPALNAFDTLKSRRGQQETTFTSVGYGVQRMFPDAAAWKIEAERVRMVASPRLVQLDTTVTGDYSMLVSANARTGGQCYGDSGGPSFVGTSNVVGGVTSYSVNDLCKGTGGVFRMDRSWALDWVRGFLPTS